MIKTHPKSKIVQFHHTSIYAKKLIGTSETSDHIVLQLEVVSHQEYDFIAKIVSIVDYEKENK
jgi:hypothetical protein